MAQRAQTHTLLSPDEYLEQELESPVKREFVDGAVYAMAGASERHNLVAGNLFALLHAHLPDRCKVFTADMKLRVKAEAATLFYYPDLMISCAEIDSNRYFHERPILLGEVLSPSTERVDRTEKFDAYRRIPSLMEYVLADQDTPKVEVFRRRAGWAREVYFPDDRLTLESAALEMTVAQIYRRVKF